MSWVKHLTALIGILVLVLTSCTSTVPGSARKSVDPSNPDDVTVAVLDTGNYPTAAKGIAGTVHDRDEGSHVEAMRMSEYVHGPWEYDRALRESGIAEVGQTGYLATPLTTTQYLFPDPLANIATAHGFVSGFSTSRADRGTDHHRELLGAVLRFPDPASAADAARDMSDHDNGEDRALPSEFGATTRHRITLSDSPESIAWSYDRDNGTEVRSYTAHGVYILFYRARITSADPAWVGARMAGYLVEEQGRVIERFTPTDPGELLELPLDPTGWLLAHVLEPTGINMGPNSVGTWPAGGALHFEEDPIESKTLFDTAGVRWMAQRFEARVYEARDVDGAGLLVDKYAKQTSAMPNVAAAPPIPGMPHAKCFVRSGDDVAAADQAALIRQLRWHYKCFARADRYAFSVFSSDLRDAMQQTSAQWRILAGK